MSTIKTNKILELLELAKSADDRRDFCYYQNQVVHSFNDRTQQTKAAGIVEAYARGWIDKEQAQWELEEL